MAIQLKIGVSSNKITKFFQLQPNWKSEKSSNRLEYFTNLCGPEIIEIFNTLALSAEDKKKYNAVVAVV